MATPPFIWLTQDGAGLVSAESYREPRWPVMPHASTVARARLWLEAHPDPAMRAAPGSWVSERAWRHKSRIGKNVAVYVPDGEMTNAAGQRVAVEVEIAPKGTARTVDKVRRAATAFEWLLFIVQDSGQTTRNLRTAVVEASQQAGDDIARRVLITELPRRLDR